MPCGRPALTIEPSTSNVRCSGPYDSIATYEVETTHSYNLTNKETLRRQYDMCVHEDIMAKQAPQSTK